MARGSKGKVADPHRRQRKKKERDKRRAAGKKLGPGGSIKNFPEKSRNWYCPKCGHNNGASSFCCRRCLSNR